VLEIQARILKVHPEHTFTIARGSADEFSNVVLTLREDRHAGYGLAAPSERYGQDADSALAALEGVEVKDPWNIRGTLRANAHLPSSALSALDAALHDLAASRLGVPVYRMLGLGRPRTTTAYTLGIDDLETTLERARGLSRYPIFKVKVGGERDIETVRAVVRETGAEIWVDANEAFSPDEAPEAARELAAAGVAVIEQPVPASAGPGTFGAVSEAAGSVPVIADESILVAADVPPLAGYADGVNVKLSKCGGIRGALEIIHTARAHGMKVMLGCMVEASLGISAAAQVSGLVDYVDLDGALLLADDPFTGLGYEGAELLVPDGPGLGVEPVLGSS
jgi:L-alanine-DL-glutamate epimerase-like enolase superfamily enzyme